MSRISDEIHKFNETCMALEKRGFTVSSPAPYCYVIESQGKAVSSRVSTKGIDLMLMGLTHGNEFAGVAILNEVLLSLQSPDYHLSLKLCLCLGNPWAALENKRFLESDLNRSFMSSQVQTREQKRARELEAVIGDVAFLVDFHQTREPSEEPFFIFPYSQGGFSFARSLSPETPVVTHWGKPFSGDGSCTDEYCNTQGGTGITIELGQNGFGSYKIAAGYRIAMRALERVSGRKAEKIDIQNPEEQPRGDLYTWASSVAGEADCFLEPGLMNFSEVKKGQVIAQMKGEPIKSEVDGRVLFPFYPRKTDTKVPAEICRIMKKIHPSDLPDK